ncbi:tetraspanin-17-like [Saccoglossus kowalevskii]|uniref:Tetraspanin n=1 Tax=Saccoglossus kowalevskii TaxID=10224 RepID=A0ABM0GID0_SACKO|nr:PREDICTED: tetraspanin-17-like [Saccoglossus kowalevskii]
MSSSQKKRARQQQGDVNKCVKYSIFFYNFVFWVIGTFLLAFGVWGLVSKQSATIDEITGLVVDPMWMFIALGSVIFIVSFSGCIGALRENTCLLNFFCLALGVIMILEITAVVLAFVYRDEVGDLIGDWIENAIYDYTEDPDINFLLDEMQTSLKCCGANHPDDWDNNVYFNCSSPAVMACGVPHSCCRPEEDGGVNNKQCGYGIRALPEVQWHNYIWIEGCVDLIHFWLLQNIIIITVVIGIILILQIISIFFVRNLVGDIQMIKALW